MCRHFTSDELRTRLHRISDIVTVRGQLFEVLCLPSGGLKGLQFFACEELRIRACEIVIPFFLGLGRCNVQVLSKNRDNRGSVLAGEHRHCLRELDDPKGDYAQIPIRACRTNKFQSVVERRINRLRLTVLGLRPRGLCTHH